MHPPKDHNPKVHKPSNTRLTSSNNTVSKITICLSLGNSISPSILVVKVVLQANASVVAMLAKEKLG
jgi:hypothetical protein